MKAENLLFILSDEHSRSVLGCRSNGYIKTPYLDDLVKGGTLFENAYCNSPICVPARASLATGRYVHEIGCWDNASPYHGQHRSWGHRLIEAGHSVVSVGKLHYRDTNDENGFSEEILPLHVLKGRGDTLGLLRRDLRTRKSCGSLARDAGRGESSYTAYDRRITAAACDWLRGAARVGDKPWVLFVGFVCPHFPLIAPPEFFDLYPLGDVPPPAINGSDHPLTHPVLTALRSYMNYDDYFDEVSVRRARAAYYGMVSFLDQNVGRVLEALEDSGLAVSTRVIYTSDHGDNLGNRGLWGKSVMYEDSVGIPLIIRGSGVPKGHHCGTAVSLVDCYPTILEALGEAGDTGEQPRPGRSLFEIALAPAYERTVLSEYHAAGSVTGMFMIRHGRWKYIHYPGYRPQLFDLETDPSEAEDLAASQDHETILTDCEQRLREILDPDAVTELAFAEQSLQIQALGGPDQIRMEGEYGFTPAPGQSPEIFASEANHEGELGHASD